ncbi:SigB/SigF/SigG family RNA polymerase sigma factor, partial [Streptomyces sp. NPDC047860]|uniref:SigB/SigF/SigG family RNA polymerase sigma factor n=1 Tax=Streptomyces sp. NPDC047860 TaxID=3155743 RepID=UPI0033C9E379
MSTPSAAAVPEPSSEELDALLRELSAQPPGLRRAALRDQVIRRLLPMARRVTRRFHRQGEEFDDLLQVASLGLIKAVDGYDPARGHAFLSYALPKVTGELRRHLRDRTHTVRLPRPLQEASGRILQAVEELEQRLGGSSPTAEQIAAHTGLGRDRVLSTLRAVHACRPRSLDEPAGHGQESSLAALIGAEDPALGRVVDTVALAALVKQLPERDRRVLYLRFYRERTQQQIADAIGVSQMHVSRILRRCLDRLRGSLLAAEPGPGSGDAATGGPVAGRTVRPTRPPCARRGAAEPPGPKGPGGRT